MLQIGGEVAGVARFVAQLHMFTFASVCCSMLELGGKKNA